MSQLFRPRVETILLLALCALLLALVGIIGGVIWAGLAL